VAQLRPARRDPNRRGCVIACDPDAWIPQRTPDVEPPHDREIRRVRKRPAPERVVLESRREGGGDTVQVGAARNPHGRSIAQYRHLEMTDLKPAYLVHGDDEVKLDSWRARLRARAAREGSDATFEVLAGDQLTPSAFARAT